MHRVLRIGVDVGGYVEQAEYLESWLTNQFLVPIPMELSWIPQKHQNLAKAS